MIYIHLCMQNNSNEIKSHHHQVTHKNSNKKKSETHYQIIFTKPCFVISSAVQIKIYFPVFQCFQYFLVYSMFFRFTSVFFSRLKFFQFSCQTVRLIKLWNRNKKQFVIVYFALYTGCSFATSFFEKNLNFIISRAHKLRNNIHHFIQNTFLYMLSFSKLEFSNFQTWTNEI